MTDEKVKSGESNVPDTSLLALLARAEEFEWMLQVATFALFVETSLILTRQKNILTFPWAKTDWAAEIGPIIILGIVFSLLVAALLPLTEALIGFFVRQVYSSPLSRFFKSGERSQRPIGCVSAWELRLQADREQSDYLLSKFKEVELRSAQADAKLNRQGRTAFRFIAILSANLFVGTHSTPSTIRMVSNFFDYDTYLFLLFLVYSCFTIICCRYWCREIYPREWVAYAPLYEEIVRKEALRRSRQYD